MQVLVESDLCWGIGLDGEAAFLVVASEILGFVLPVIPSPSELGHKDGIFKLCFIQTTTWKTGSAPHLPAVVVFS